MSLATIIQVLTAIPQLATLINQIVQDIEAAFPGLSGNQKYSAAAAKLQVYLSAAIQDTALVANAMSVAQPLINAAVAVFNVTGLFKSKSAAAGTTVGNPQVNLK